MNEAPKPARAAIGSGDGAFSIEANRNLHADLTHILTSKATAGMLNPMLKIKVSSKRQATFPKQVCESLGIEPGDEVLLDRRTENDREVWFLRPAKDSSRPWIGSLRPYAANKAHDMDSVRASIARGRISTDH